MNLKAVERVDNYQRFFLSPDYALGYIALSISSNEEFSLPRAIGHLWPKLTLGLSSGSLLDIGCADGRITQAVGRAFRRVSVFEPNQILFSLAVSRLSRLKFTLEARNTTFPDGPAVSHEHDVIVASHMLYHIEKRLWPDFFSSVANALRPGGICFVVLWNHNSEAKRITQSFAKERWLCCAEEVIDEPRMLHDSGLAIVQQINLEPIIKANSKEMASLIADFLIGPEGRSEAARGRDIEPRLLALGIRNSQSILALRKA